MKELFEQRNIELTQDLEQQRKLIENLQAQLNELASEHKAKAEAVHNLEETQEKAEALITELRKVIKQISLLGKPLLDTYIERINEVILGSSNITKNTPATNFNNTEEKKPQELATEVITDTSSSEEQEVEVPVASISAQEETPLEAEQSVKILTDKYNCLGEIGVIKQVLTKPNGFKYKIQLARGLFTFSRSDIEESLEAQPLPTAIAIPVEEQLPF